MKTKTILTIFLIIAALALFIYIITRGKEIQFKEVDLPETSNYVGNHTDLKYIDTVIYLGINKLGIEGVFVNVLNMSPDVRDNFTKQTGQELKACIVGEGYQYAIYVNENMKRGESLTILSHELYHLQQYHSKRLVVLENGIVNWEGNNVDVLSVPYNDRPWEIEAFNNQRKLESELRKILY
jgi:hypothetical protein